jgi:hypothetical protein
LQVDLIRKRRLAHDPVSAEHVYGTHRFMAPIVNLRTERKRAKRLQAEQLAAANRLAHGRSKAERNLERSRSDKDKNSLDQRRIETETENEIAGR